MEIKAILEKPYTEEERIEFIVEQNHRLGYEIKETEEALEAWGLTEEETEQRGREQIANLHLTRGDVFRGLLLAKGVTRADIRGIIEAMPEETPQDKITKEIALIDFEEALEFYRGVSLVDAIGSQLNITTKEMDNFFKTGDWHELNNSETEIMEE